MQKWEYLALKHFSVGAAYHAVLLFTGKTADEDTVLNFEGREDFLAYLNGLGDEGWEMVSVKSGAGSSGEMWFKRPEA